VVPECRTRQSDHQNAGHRSGPSKEGIFLSPLLRGLATFH